MSSCFSESQIENHHSLRYLILMQFTGINIIIAIVVVVVVIVIFILFFLKEAFGQAI